MNLSLKETPQSVSVITSKRMQDQQLNNLIDVMKNVTGVWGTYDAGEKFYSRGYKIENVQVDGVKSSSFDDYKMGVEYMDTAIYDSVSVVRGATGLLTGAGDPSGSISLVRKKPTKDFQASLEAQAGRWDKYRGVVDIAGGFNEDGSIRGRFIAVNDQGGNFHPLSDEERSTLYGVLEADLGDSTTISGAWERIEAKTKGLSFGGYIFVVDQTTGNWVLSNHDKYTWNTADWAKYKQNTDNYTLNLEHHINDSWKINTTYMYVNEDTQVKHAPCKKFSSNDSCLNFDSANDNNDNKAYSLDVKLNGQYDLFGQTHDLMLGFNGIKNKFVYSSLEQSQTADIILINNRLVSVEPTWGGIQRTNNIETQQYGGFISTKLNFTDDLSAILGGRYSKWETKTTGSYLDDRKTDNFLPYLALTYDLTDNLTTYASYTEIFNPQSAKDRSGKLLDPETGFNYEVGIKGEWFDGKLNSSIALFKSGKDGLAVQDKDENGDCYIYSGATNSWDCAYKAEDDTKNKGWEFEVAGEITPYWQVQFGFSSSILKDKDGKRLNDTTMPVRTANLFITYRATQFLTVGGGMRWQSKTWNDFYQNRYISAGHSEMVGETKQDSYYVVDLMASYEFNKNLSLLVNINNALDKEYKTSFATYSYGDERNWMATLKYRF